MGKGKKVLGLLTTRVSQVLMDLEVPKGRKPEKSLVRSGRRKERGEREGVEVIGKRNDKLLRLRSTISAFSVPYLGSGTL